MKTICEKLLSWLFPLTQPELPEHTSDNLIPSAILIQIVSNQEDFKRVMEG